MPDGPLTPYRIVDLGSAWAGPMAAQLLADMGAQVIKVESRERMDGLRLGRPMVGDDAAGGDRGLWPELQPVFHSINRNKLGVTLNLRTDEGKDLVRSLIARSDVVMNNFSPGVLGRLGLDYPDLQKLRPDIILVSMPSVGDSGPLRDILAYAPIIQALSGLMSVVGYRPEERLAEEPRAEEPLVGELQSPWSDAVASIHAGLATLAALRHRNRTGMGQKVEVAQLEAISRLISLALRSGVDPQNVIEMLRGITCCPAWDEGTLVRSGPDAVALALERHISQDAEGAVRPAGEPVQLKLGAGAGSGGNGNGYYPARKCPDCNTPVIFQEGCLMCVSCGWNKCE